MAKFSDVLKGPKRSRFAMCDATWLKMNLTARELRVLLALSLHADWSVTGHGRCYPKRDTLALATDLEISHVSESVRTLSDVHHLICVVRLGRKNIYYVRQIGSTTPMPPSDAGPYFTYLSQRGVRFVLVGGELAYATDTARVVDELGTLHRAIISDYQRGLTPARLAAAVQANQQAKEHIPV